MHASPAALPVNSDRPDVDTRLPALLAQTVGDVATGSRPAGRTAVRRRVALLRRRRRLRRVLGSSTLAAGMVAGGVHTRLDGHTSPVATVPATPAVPGGGAPLTRPTSALAPAQPGTSWSWDPGEGVDREAADPGALYADGGFHVYATSATHCLRGGCRVYRVPRFGSPEPALPGRLDGDAMPGRPDWVAPDDDAIWAPAAARIGDRYVLYFAASSAGSGDAPLKCLGAAISTSPAGPFAPLPNPLHCTPGYWSIDPYPVTDGQRWYLLWRQDDGANVTGRIVAARLSPDGLALAGSETRTLLVGSFSWEEGYPNGTPGIGPVENPAMARHPATGEWLLTWSANRWETQDYATGLAVCAGPLGPCRRTTGASPWFRTARTRASPARHTWGAPGACRSPPGPATISTRCCTPIVAPVRLPGPCGWRGHIGSNPRERPLAID
jgi:Glycosyl hydrolases family 43